MSSSPPRLTVCPWTCFFRPFLFPFFQIIDFNLSKLIADQGNSSVAAMNPRWLAPELMQGERATLASDVFAFGVVLWEVMTWQLPWGSANPWTVSCPAGGWETRAAGHVPACPPARPLAACMHATWPCTEAFDGGVALSAARPTWS
jgi:hypothetical protein